MRSVASTIAVVSVALAVVAIAGARAQESAAPGDAPFSIELRKGDGVALCSTGTLVCPARGVICDAPGVVAVEGGASGIVLRGAKAGTTLCSASGASGARRVYRVTVVEPPDAGR